MADPITTLTEETLLHAVGELAARDVDLARIVDRIGPPPLWAREPGFPTLVHMILEQQVSLASARAAFERLLALATPLTPTRFLTCDDEILRGIGFSRQKTRYCRLLAQTLLAGDLDLDELNTLPDDAVRTALTRLTGIGPWTADVYLLMVLRRPDIWPIGDRALVVAARQVKNLEQDPTPEEMLDLGVAWQPWRAVAARLLWHHYLTD